MEMTEECEETWVQPRLSHACCPAQEHSRMSPARCAELFATHRKLVSKGTAIHMQDSPSPWLHFCLQTCFL